MGACGGSEKENACKPQDELERTPSALKVWNNFAQPVHAVFSLRLASQAQHTNVHQAARLNDVSALDLVSRKAPERINEENKVSFCTDAARGWNN